MLKNPWRCSLHLFTSDVTRVLLLVYVVLWTAVAVGFVGIDSSWRSARSWVVAIFVSVSSRTSGFTIVDFTQLPNSFCLLVIGSMFIAAYPIAMLRKQGKAVRKNEAGRPVRPRKKLETIYKYWRAVFLSHTTWLYAIVVVISYLEVRPGRPEMNLLAILFEVVSGYGTVGYSFGAPGKNVSLAGIMHPVSKLGLMLSMLLGRNRGLPRHVYPKDMREGVAQEVVMTDLES